MGTEALTEPLRETLAQFDESGEPRTTTEVAAALDLGRRSTYNRLERLAEHGRIETKKVGANARVWWRPPAAAGGTDPDWSATAESLVDDVLDDVEVGIFVLDENYEVAWTNETIERYFGLGRERAIGRDKRRLVDERIAAVVDDSEAFAETVLATYDDNTDSERFECRVRSGEGREERWLEHRSEPIESGAYAGGRVELYYDVTDRKRAQAARREDREELESLVDAVEEYAIFRLDADGHVRTWNAGAEQIKGYAEDEILGEHVSTFYTEADREIGTVEENLAAAADEGSIEGEGWRVRADGSRFWANVTLSAVRDGDGALRGYVKVVRDMTERRRAEAERELLYETTRSVAEAETFEEGLQAALRDVSEATDWEYAEAWIPTDDGELQRAEVDYRVDDLAEFAALSEEYTFEPGEGTPGRVYASGEFEWMADLPAETEGPFLRLDEALDADLKSALGVPVVADDEVVAVLTFLLRRHRETDERFVELVSSVAAELGALIARRRAQESLERERELVERIFETAPVGISIFSSDRTLERTNERMAELIGLSADEATEYTAGDLSLRGAGGEPLPFEERPVGRVFETDEPVFDREVEVTRPDGTDRWLSVNAAPLTDEDCEVPRVIATVTDVTRRKEQAARLERRRAELESELDEVFERIDDAFYALDDEMRFEYVNERAEELLGYPEGELLGRTVWDALDVAPDDPIRDRFDAAMASQEPTSFERFSEPLDIWEVVRLYPSETGLSVYFTEITERKEYERELEEYRRWTQTLVDNFPSGAIALVDQEMQYVTFGGRLEGDTDLTRADLEGDPVQDALPDQIAEVVVPGYEAALDGEASEFEAEIDGRVYQYHFAPVRDDHGDVFAATAMSQDVTERKERERLLREAKSQLEAATEAGAVGTWEWHVQEDRFVAGLSMAQTFGVDPEAAREGVSIDRYVSAVHEEDRERVERAIDEALADCGEYEQEYRVRDADGDLRWVVARGRVECDETGDPVTFPGAIVDITNRKCAEQELERRREQLAALNGLNEVVRDITGAVVEQSTREEIERTVCERLAATESYLFAWTGEVDPSSQTVRLQAEAGVEGYLDDITISVDPDDARSEGPTGRALRTGETQVTHDIRVDSRHDPWRAHIEEYGIRSSAAIPITHEGTVYGVLNVYADRPHAFEGQEREVIDQLGAVAGHAIAAAERKQALLSEELIEIDYQIGDVFGAVDAPVETNGTITLDETVPVEDDEFLVYGTTTTDAVDTLHGLVEALPHWKEVTVHSDSDPASFELRLVDPPVLSVVASYGGYVDEVVFEDGDYRMTIHLAPGADVRRVTDAVGEAYPQAEMIRRRQITRSHDETRQVRRSVATSLTNRQRTALEAAYYAGFFEWPREATGEDVAESLGLAPPTFHNHLRKAQRKVLDALLSTPIPNAG